MTRAAMLIVERAIEMRLRVAVSIRVIRSNVLNPVVSEAGEGGLIHLNLNTITANNLC